jgi:hypothetical protein
MRTIVDKLRPAQQEVQKTAHDQDLIERGSTGKPSTKRPRGGPRGAAKRLFPPVPRKAETKRAAPVLERPPRLLAKNIAIPNEKY